MKKVTYHCKDCWKLYSFQENETNYVCPICKKQLRYWSTEEIDPETGKVINSYMEESRRSKNPIESCSSQYKHLNPVTITCPYCKSTNTKKISSLSKAGSVALFGIFALGKTTKQWHCNSCKSDF